MHKGAKQTERRKDILIYTYIYRFRDKEEVSLSNRKRSGFGFMCRKAKAVQKLYFFAELWKSTLDCSRQWSFEWMADRWRDWRKMRKQKQWVMRKPWVMGWSWRISVIQWSHASLNLTFAIMVFRLLNTMEIRKELPFWFNHYLYKHFLFKSGSVPKNLEISIKNGKTANSDCIQNKWNRIIIQFFSFFYREVRL